MASSSKQTPLLSLLLIWATIHYFSLHAVEADERSLATAAAAAAATQRQARPLTSDLANDNSRHFARAKRRQTPVSEIQENAIPAASANFEAAFQGECNQNAANKQIATGSNPCEHICLDLHDGTYECSCFYGFTLAVDGYSCARLASGSPQLPRPPQVSPSEPGELSARAPPRAKSSFEDKLRRAADRKLARPTSDTEAARQDNEMLSGTAGLSSGGAGRSHLGGVNGRASGGESGGARDPDANAAGGGLRTRRLIAHGRQREQTSIQNEDPEETSKWPEYETEPRRAPVSQQADDEQQEDVRLIMQQNDRLARELERAIASNLIGPRLSAPDPRRAPAPLKRRRHHHQRPVDYDLSLLDQLVSKTIVGARRRRRHHALGPDYEAPHSSESGSNRSSARAPSTRGVAHSCSNSQPPPCRIPPSLSDGAQDNDDEQEPADE